MKTFSASSAWSTALLLGMGWVAGCGGSSGGGTTPPPAPSITSFAATPATITAGESSSLTGVFANGAGAITPGNIAVASGVAVSLSPATTTTYTLTVVNLSGTEVTQTVTVTVNPGPTITSFTANPPAITAGQSSSLTAVFANGTGVITPGNLSVTSGAAVSVSPAATTTYTLTVTSSDGKVTATQTATVGIEVPSTVTVDQSSVGPAVTDQLLGMNLGSWYDIATNKAAIVDAFGPASSGGAGIKAVRWPGGSLSDVYHWQTNTNCQVSKPGQGLPGEPDSDATFANFVSDIAIPAGLDVALTANYGTNAACTGGGDPTEAAAWAADALTLGLTVSHMTVGNEEYGSSWEEDLHSLENDPTTYTAAVAGTNGYYALIKAASTNTLVGVDVEPDYAPWDQDVMSGAPYDFVEYHYYPETPGLESDSFLVNQAAQNLTTNINTIKSELTQWGKPGTPIYVGEIGGPYSNPGKQSWSITQGLYAGQVLGEMMNDGVSRLTWWIGFENCNGTSGNDSSSLYGWQDFGAYNVFSDGPSDSGCPDAGPIGTLSPTARAFQLFSSVAVTGENVLNATVAGNTADVVAYAATHGGGTALVLFNRNETTSELVTITLSVQDTATSVTVETYDKAIYDQSNPATTNTWAPPISTSLGAQSLPLSLTLTPWSMNVVIIQ
jgi:hypothetical protein